MIISSLFILFMRTFSDHIMIKYPENSRFQDSDIGVQGNVFNKYEVFLYLIL